ncbi:uncharacterized protein TRIADDRAFT_31561, partial [Trichoplax adhaerens]
APSSYPRNITVIALSSTSIYITWQSLRFVDRNGIITSYTICYNSTQWNDNGVVQVGSSTTNTFLLGNSRNYTVFNMKYFSKYKISIQAFTIAGVSPRSNEYIINTLESGMF